MSGLIDYDALQATAETFLPKIVICGASAYPRDYDYKRLREVVLSSLYGAFLCSFSDVGVDCGQSWSLFDDRYGPF